MNLTMRHTTNNIHMNFHRLVTDKRPSTCFASCKSPDCKEATSIFTEFFSKSQTRPASLTSPHIFRHSQPTPHLYRPTMRHIYNYRPAKISTNLSGLNVDDVNERLICRKESFNMCSFLLPGFKRTLQESAESSALVLAKVESSISATVSQDRGGGIGPNRRTRQVRLHVIIYLTLKRNLYSHLLLIKRRLELARAKEIENRIIVGHRISCVICAFGGQPQKMSAAAPTQSHYTESIVNRFYEHESRLSWNIEDSPPVESIDTRYHSTSENASMKRIVGDFEISRNAPKKLKPSAIPPPPTNGSLPNLTDDAPKMKYCCAGNLNKITSVRLKGHFREALASLSIQP